MSFENACCVRRPTQLIQTHQQPRVKLFPPQFSSCFIRADPRVFVVGEAKQELKIGFSLAGMFCMLLFANFYRVCIDNMENLLSKKRLNAPKM